MEEGRGNGIFLGVVSVATLIVAIIGATFAYFSASTQSEPNTVNLGAYEFKLSLSVSQVYPTNASAASGLIPLVANKVITGAEDLVPNNTNLLYAINVAKNRCVDDNGLQVCALYRVLINNQGSNPVTLTGQIKTTSNEAGEGDNKTPFSNLTYQAVGGELGEVNETGKLTLEGDPVPLATDVDGLINISSIEIDGAQINQNTGQVIEPGTGEGYILIYLDDKNENQSSEMGATYTGQLIYSSGNGVGNTLTGTFTVGGSTDDEEENTTQPEEPTTEEE